MNRILLFLRHSFALIREDKLFSAIYIAGTAVAIASAMVIAIFLNIQLGDVAPESNRSRTLYLQGSFNDELTPGGERYRYDASYSMTALDSCFRKMDCVEAAAGIMRGQETIGDEAGEHNFLVDVMRCDPDFFRLYDLDFVKGRPFSEKEFRNGEYECVVTEKVAKQLGGADHFVLPGKDGRPVFHIVGVVKTVSSLLGQTAYDIYVPYTNYSFGFVPDASSAPDRNGHVLPYKTYHDYLEVRILLREGYSRQDFLDEIEPLRRHYNAMVSNKVGDKDSWMLWAKSHYFNNMNFFSADEESFSDKAENMLPPAILMLLFLLLPAINLSGLVSNRMEARRAEMGIRKAFGAKRRELLNEVIHENLVLTLLGGAVGWVLSWLFLCAVRNSEIFHVTFTLREKTYYEPTLDFQMFFTPTLFLVAFLCCAVLNLMAALIPSWHSLRKPIVESLNQKR
jgi:putative ABC transport system permease protein